MDACFLHQILLVLSTLICYMTCTETVQNEPDTLSMKTESDGMITTEKSAVATTVKSYRNSRLLQRGFERGDYSHEDNDENDNQDSDNDNRNTGVSQGKADYWNGYYDFLINEGSYKFWAVFQLATAALLIYSGFAALYYAKVNPPSGGDYDDYYLRRRRRSLDYMHDPDTYSGLSPQVFQRIMDAIENDDY